MSKKATKAESPDVVPRDKAHHDVLVEPSYLQERCICILPYNMLWDP